MVKSSIVSDSTCLIGMERIQSLEILPSIFDSIVIPPEVQQEFGNEFPLLRVEAPSNHGLVRSLKLLVDDGEAEAIALAYEKSWRVILDDRHARAVAKRLDVTVIGTVGILVKAKQQGHIVSVRPLIEQLEMKGFYISKALKQEALRLAVE